MHVANNFMSRVCSSCPAQHNFEISDESKLCDLMHVANNFISRLCISRMPCVFGGWQGLRLAAKGRCTVRGAGALPPHLLGAQVLAAPRHACWTPATAEAWAPALCASDWQTSDPVQYLWFYSNPLECIAIAVSHRPTLAERVGVEGVRAAPVSGGLPTCAPRASPAPCPSRQYPLPLVLSQYWSPHQSTPPSS